MGWTALLDENDKEIGIVGDSGWDLAASFLDDLNAIYVQYLGRGFTEDEAIETVRFVLGRER
jgi:hypothetical protein